MGIRSEVIVCLKKSIVDKLSPEQREEFFGDADQVSERDEGTAFRWDDVKWYRFDGSVERLYEFLKGEECADFLVVVATGDFPSDDSDDVGDWKDNPWDAHKSISVHADWNE